MRLTRGTAQAVVGTRGNPRATVSQAHPETLSLSRVSTQPSTRLSTEPSTQPSTHTAGACVNIACCATRVVTAAVAALTVATADCVPEC